MNTKTTIIGLVVLLIIFLIALAWPKTAGPNLETGLVASSTGLEVELATSTALSPTSTPKPSTMTLKAFFGNRNYDPESKHCEVVYPVWREVPRTVAVGRAALTELLNGPTDAEAGKGVITALNPGVTLDGLTIASGVARADFSATLGSGVGGACRTAAIRAQITETLKQFPTVQNVVISINGQSQDILQP